MAARTIIRSPDILDGRWHLEGTEIPIGEIQQTFLTTHDGPKETFRYAELSAEDIAAALDFAFPPIREAWVDLRPAMVQANCVCGEHSTTITTGEDNKAELHCVCGRSWTVQVLVAPSPARVDVVQTSR